MKKTIWIVTFSFCSMLGFAQGNGYADDLYQSKTSINRKAKNDTKTSETTVSSGGANSGTYTYVPQAVTGGKGAVAPDIDADNKELIVSYDEALQRRLNAYKEYKEMDEDYWKLMEGYHAMLTNKYDRDLYNVVTFGNEIWVEPKYITALFDGSDPAEGVNGKELVYNKQPQTTTTNVSITLVNDWDPLYYGRYRYYDRYRYYGGWGPSWGFGFGWNTYWGWRPYSYWGGYYPPSWGWGGGWGPWYPHRPSYYPPHRPPIYNGRPVIWGSGGGGHPAGSIRPGTPGNAFNRPTYSGYRRNENGTNVSIRPGNAGNSYLRPATGTSVNQNNTGDRRPSQVTTSPSGQSRPNRGAVTNTTTTPSRNTNTNTNTQQNTRRETTTPTYTPAPSTPSNSGGGTSGGGGVRRR